MKKTILIITILILLIIIIFNNYNKSELYIQSPSLSNYKHDDFNEYINAYENDNIEGLLLFSPAYIPRDIFHNLAYYANFFINWLDYDINEKNYTRYANLAVNGAVLYSESVKKVNKYFNDKKYSKPVLIVLSENDSVVNSQETIKLFNEKFINKKSKLIWYGNTKLDDNRIINKISYIPEKNISNFSHMGILFSPENYYYGENGTQLICDNGQSEKDEKICPITDELWYSSYDYIEKGKIHARLTWNPYFYDMEKYIKHILTK